MVKLLTMKNSANAKQFMERILNWEDQLKYTFELFDYIIKVQSVWMWLEPVMTSPDIIKQLPKEGEEFKKVDWDWRNQVMGKIQKQTKVLEFTKDRRMLDSLKESDKSLDIVQKALNGFLETKRGSFPRFYFLSDAELLEILSETKDPMRVQPHLGKCFEGIKKLKFDDKGEKIIHGMYSSEGEYVEFLNVVKTAVANGNVDVWLSMVEERMVEAVHYQTQTAF